LKQIFSKVFIEDSGDSCFIPGTRVRYEEFSHINKQLEKEGKKAAR